MCEQAEIAVARFRRPKGDFPGHPWKRGNGRGFDSTRKAWRAMCLYRQADIHRKRFYRKTDCASGCRSSATSGAGVGRQGSHAGARRRGGRRGRQRRGVGSVRERRAGLSVSGALLRPSQSVPVVSAGVRAQDKTPSSRRWHGP